MAAIFAALKNIAKNVVPVAWNIAQPMLQAGVNAIESMDGTEGRNYYSNLNSTSVDLRPLIRNMDDPISEKDRRQEEVLVVTNAEITQRQLLQFVQEQMKVEEYAFEMPLNGLARSSVILSFHAEYTFSTEKTNLKIKNVNYNDHVYFHLIPKDFAFYDMLLKHDLFQYKNTYIKSASTSGFDTTTMIGFFPITTDTSNCTNGLLMQLCKRLETKPDEEVKYNIRYAAPDVITYQLDANKQRKDIKSKYMFLEANKIVKTDNVIALDEEENTDLSYGTIVIVKQNVGQIVGMSFTINMEFDVWDYVINGIKLSEIKDKNLNGIPDEDEGDSGSSKPEGSFKPTGRRRKE